MHYPVRNSLAALLALLLFPPVALAGETEFALAVGSGYDSNPYRLSSKEQSGAFVEIDADLDYENPLSEVSTFFLSLDGSSQQYFGSVSDESDYRAGIEGGMEFKLDLPGRDRFKMKLGAASDMKRGTFISRFTGQVGENGGNPVPERFDYNRRTAFVESDYYLGYDLKFTLDLEFEDKNYVNDYAALGADRLDNSEWTVEPKFEYEFTDAWQLELFTEFAHRTYDDRTVDDASGVAIPGSNREYDYQEYGFEFQYQPDDNREWSFGASTGERRDNGGGYWDYDKFDAFVKLEQSLGSNAAFSVELYRTDKQYDTVVIATTPEEQYARTGNGLKLEYERRILAASTDDLRLFAELEHFDGSESIDRSAYVRTTLMVGLDKSF